MVKPNLFIVGSMKSGTTSLHNYLDQHDDIFMSKAPLKETQYFVEELNWKRGEDWYASLFRGVRDEKVVGESTTDYTKRPRYEGVADRIKEFNPNAKIIAIMRDPVERTISHYWHDVRFELESRNMRQAIAEGSHFRDFSHYAMQLQPYFDCFGKENVCTLTLEQLKSDTQGKLREICEWLELPYPSEGLSLDACFRNSTPDDVTRVRGAFFLQRLKGSRPWKFLKVAIRNQRTREWLRDRISRPIRKEDSTQSDAIDFLRPIQVEQTRRLEDMLERSFPEWTTLYGEHQEDVESDLLTYRMS